ncbi:hypothetical protein FRB90_008082, partial [Tulasnella sp. 427]
MDEDTLPSNRKRKRGTGNENMESNGGGLVNKSPLKRSKSAYASLGKGRAPSNHNMSVDEPPARRATVVVERTRQESEDVPDDDEDTEPEDGPIDSSDDHYVSSAPPWQLRRLKKEDLLRIYGLAGLSSVGDVGEDLTKTDLINAIVRARKNSKGSATSPRNRTASTRSPPSSFATTDGNDAGAEESDAFNEEDDFKKARKLRRSATTNTNLGMGLPSTQLKKSQSMNFRDVPSHPEPESSNRRARFAADQKKADTRRTTSSRQNLSRKVKQNGSLREPDSEDDHRDFPADHDTIEESQDEEVDELMDDDTQPTVRATQPDDESSDLTELSDAESSDLTEVSDEEDNFGDQAEESPAPEETPKPPRTRSRQSRRSQDSSRSLKRSSQDIATVAQPLTRRASRRKLRSPTPEMEEELEEDEIIELPGDDDAEAEGAEDDAEEVEAEQRVLRNGKVVGAADDEEEEDQIDEDESFEDAEPMEEDGDLELVDEKEEEDEDMDGDFDLTEATAKSLIKLRRDDLVRLCEARDLEPEGTKTQLVTNLLQWRDQVAQAPSSSGQPSSKASTVRAPSTYRGSHHNGNPVLLRSHRVH